MEFIFANIKMKITICNVQYNKNFIVTIIKACAHSAQFRGSGQPPVCNDLTCPAGPRKPAKSLGQPQVLFQGVPRSAVVPRPAIQQPKAGTLQQSRAGGLQQPKRPAALPQPSAAARPQRSAAAPAKPRLAALQPPKPSGLMRPSSSRLQQVKQARVQLEPPVTPKPPAGREVISIPYGKFFLYIQMPSR